MTRHFIVELKSFTETGFLWDGTFEEETSFEEVNLVIIQGMVSERKMTY